MSVFRVRPLAVLTGRLSGKGEKRNTKRQEEKQNLEYVTNMCFMKHIPASASVHSPSNSSQTGPSDWWKPAKVKSVLFERWKSAFVEVSEFSWTWFSLLFHPSHTVCLGIKLSVETHISKEQTDCGGGWNADPKHCRLKSLTKDILTSGAAQDGGGRNRRTWRNPTWIWGKHVKLCTDSRTSSGLNPGPWSCKAAMYPQFNSIQFNFYFIKNPSSHRLKSERDITENWKEMKHLRVCWYRKEKKNNKAPRSVFFFLSQRNLPPFTIFNYNEHDRLILDHV